MNTQPIDQSFPPGELDKGGSAHSAVEIRGYNEVLEVLRSQKFATENGAGDGDFRRGAMLRLHGAEHTRRRRTINHLIRDHERLRNSYLYPALKTNLAEVLGQRDSHGLAHADLVSFISRTSVQVACAMMGLSGTDNPDRVNELMELAASFRQVPGVRWVVDPEGRRKVIANAEEAKRIFKERFFLPSLEQHRDLLVRFERGEIVADDLPRDFLTLIAAHSDYGLVEAIGARVDPTYSNLDNALSEGVTSLINGAIDTTTGTITWCVDELTRWFAQHPEDVHLSTDPRFLNGAVSESLRLHPGLLAIWRVATEDVHFTSGFHIDAGQLVALRTDLASRDPSTFGADAEEFKPGREIPRGAAAYGLAFGAGPHMCYGMPLVLGEVGTDGSLVHILASLYAAGMVPDPEALPQLAPGTSLQKFIAYPVAFRPAVANA